MATKKKKTKKKKATKKKKTAKKKPAPPRPRALPPKADALLQQILADPDDLDLRRVYADLLLEHGDPRGEQIQLACALERMADDDPKRDKTQQSVHRQQRRHALPWSRALRQVGPFNKSAEGPSPFTFARGFPEQLRGPAEEIVPHLEAATRAAPIRALHLELSAASCKALASSPALCQIRALTLDGDDDDLPTAAVIKLLASPHLKRLERFSYHGRLDPKLAAALAGCEALGGCRELELSDSGSDDFSPDGQLLARERLGSKGLRTLCASGKLALLTTLTLGRAGVGVDGIEALTALQGLRRLSITDEALGVKGARALSEVAGLASLQELTLERCGLKEASLVALVQKPSFADLRRLDLPGPGNGLGQGHKAMLDALHLPRLEALGLDQGMIRAAGAEQLATCKALKKLKALDLSGCGLKDAGLEALAQARLPRLRKLVLRSNGLGEGGLEALGQGRLLSPVRDLNLAGNKFNNAGGKALAASPHLAKLERLLLHYNWLGVGGLKALLAAAPALVELHAGENNYTNTPGKVVAAGALPRLRHLHTYQHDGPTITRLAQSPAGQQLESLALTGAPIITDEGAEALAASPALGGLRLSFPSISPAGMALLRARFGPFLSVWPSVKPYNKHPGPS